MTTWTAISLSQSLDVASQLQSALETLSPKPMGVAAIELEDGSGLFEVAAYFQEKPDDIALMLLAAAHDARPFVISKLPERDWVAQVRRELTPVRAERFLVFGGHDRDQLFPSDYGIEIDAAMAFGTGHHGTTLGCLLLTRALYRKGFQPARIADIGTGTGVLAMAGLRQWKSAHAIAGDIENIAVETAQTNFRTNHITRAHAVQSIGFRNALLNKGAEFDLIYANILANPLRRLAPDMHKFCKKRGYIILSGILRRQGQSVLATYRAHGFQCIEDNKQGEWISFLLQKA